MIFLPVWQNLAGQTAGPEEIVQVSELPGPLTESSGLLLLEDGTLLSHNDSGSKPELYVFSPGSNEVLRRIAVKGAGNRDWEEITADQGHIYIGDFGNNSGSRKDLVIYIVDMENLMKDDVVSCEEIRFSYPEQRSFFPSLSHNFDCEAMIAHEGVLYLFTKNRADGKSNVYTIPCKPGEYRAKQIATLEVEGLITGAALSQDRNTIACIGYTFLGANRFHPFLYIISDFEGFAFDLGRQQRISLPIIKQTEAVCFKTGTTLYFTEEEENRQQGFLYSIDLAKYLEND